MLFKKGPFETGLTRNERILGFLYLPIHVLVLPLFLSIYAYVATDAPNETTLNVIYYGISMLFVLAFMRKFLRAGFDAMLDNKLQSVLSMAMAYFINTLLSYAAVILLTLLISDFENPNNDAVNALAEQSYNATFAVAVLLGPVVEETLFRGVLFGSIRNRSRVAAYIISALTFSLYHIWQYVIAYSDPTLFLYALQYIPVSIALAWCYERSGSIWVPIFFHMIMNAASLAYMNMGL